MRPDLCGNVVVKIIVVQNQDLQRGYLCKGSINGMYYSDRVVVVVVVVFNSSNPPCSLLLATENTCKWVKSESWAGKYPRRLFPRGAFIMKRLKKKKQ